MAKGWYWRGNVAYYEFEISGTRYRGSLGIRKNSGEIDGKSPAERAEAEVRALMVQHEQKHSIEQIWEQTSKRLTGSCTIPTDTNAIFEMFSQKGMSNAGERRAFMYNSHLAQFVTWMQKNYPAVKKVSNITQEHAKEYITWLRNELGAPATKNDKLSSLKMIFFNLGLPVNPFAKIKPMPLRQVPREIFTPAEIKILFTNSTGWMRRLFITALATFQREEDCCLIKKSYIHLDINRIKFPFTHKTGQAVNLPMLPLFREIVEEALAENKDSEYLFPDLEEKYRTAPSDIGKEVKQFLAANGFRHTLLEVEGYARKVSLLDVHSLRHTAAVMAVLSGWPLPMVMKATGHKSLKMVMRYIDHISEEQKENYFFQFGQGLPGLPVHGGAKDERKQLAELAYSLPLEEVKRLLSSAQHPPVMLELTEKL